jgi:hypothetical protein
MGSMATPTLGAVTVVALATRVLPGHETLPTPHTMAYKELINVSNFFVGGRGVPIPHKLSEHI